MALKPPSAHHSLHAKALQLRSLVNREGLINVHGRERWRMFGDLYHYFFSLSWPGFFIHIALVYFGINVLFGALYYLDREGSFSSCFFLSIMSMTAVDFSRIPHDGFWINMLMCIQALLGILTIAVITGLFYARFSRPTARIVFSDKAVIGPHNGRPCLFFRMANERLNRIAEAHVSLHMTKNEVSLEGEHTRKFYDLKLEREHTPLFALSWTVRHYITEHSPLYGIDHENMRQMQMGLIASVTGTDETFAQPIMARHAYAPEDIVYNRRFKDIILWHDKKVHINLKGIHDLHEPQLAEV